MHANKEPDHVITLHDVALCVQFSPFNWCSTLLAVGTFGRIIIYSVKFPEEDPSLKEITVVELRSFQHGSYVSSVAWSPQTNLIILPKCVKFATIAGDKMLRVFMSDLGSEDTVQIFEGHKDYINDVVFEPQLGEMLASASDDHSCCVWASDGSLKAQIYLTSPGVKVCWHREDHGKLLVAEMKGIIRFYNVATQQPIMSLDCGSSPLLSCDWCCLDNLRVGCAAGTDWFIWDTSHSSCPASQKTVYSEGCTSFLFSKTNQNLIATRGNPNSVKVENTKQNQMLLHSQFTDGTGISWHSQFPVLAASGDRRVCLWKIQAV